MRIYLSIAYFSGFNSGAGGHYYSLLTMAKCLQSNNMDVAIIVFGDKIPNSYDNSGFDIYLVKKSFIEVWNVDLPIKNADVVHAFDRIASFYSRILSLNKKCGIVYTKCGGPTYWSTRYKIPFYVPKVSDVICFSTEDFNYIKDWRKDCRVHLIPNRVFRPKSDDERLVKLRKDLSSQVKKSDKIILRICRIATVYKESILQTINLSNFYNENGFSTKAIIIGKVQNKAVYEDLKKSTSGIFITDEYFHTNASELIDITDFSVGVGRGFMESSAFGKVMFATINNSQLPVLVTPSNFQTLFDNNFSSRNSVDPSTLDSEKSLLLSVFDKNIISDYQQLSLEWFKGSFDMATVFSKYKNIYLGADSAKINFDFFKHAFLDVMRSCIQIIKKVIK
jgi:hypothetical protein